MKAAVKTIVISMVICLPALSATIWQTTHDGQSNGNCQLLSNRLSVTIHPHYADVVEEAEIGTSGSVWSGDAATLEITGTFVLNPGSAVRSMLLWNGKKILKAKLLIRADADSAYEDVVDRDKIVYVRHDPAIIEYLGNDQYRFKIYPVEIGNSRKIRILYTVPLELVNNQIRFTVIPAFTLGASQNPTQIPVEIIQNDTIFNKCIIEYGSVKKNVIFNSSYAVPYASFTQRTYDSSTRLYRYSGITLSPVMNSDSYWITSVIDTGSTKGNYYAIIATQPDTINTLLEENALQGKSVTMESNVTIGEKSFLSDVPKNSSFCAYIKTDAAWDSTVTWTCYDNSSGDILVEYVQKFEAPFDPSYCSTLPLLWGAKYSLKEKKTPLGALYGFVDGQMSLLALERDTLPQSLYSDYQDQGVPLLNTDEILIKPEKRPEAPAESVLFEFSTAVQHVRTAMPDFTITLADNAMSLQFTGNINGVFNALLIDAQGRIVQEFNNVKTAGRLAKLKFRPGLKGTFVVRIISGGTLMSRKVVLY